MSATLACLSGSGTAPELMAEALYALDALGRVHGFTFEQVHVPFGGVAVARLGQTVPPSTREAVVGADAVLVAGADEPALDEVMAELDLRARLTRVRFGQSDDVVYVTAVREATSEWAVECAFGLAEDKCLRLACVGDQDWRELVESAGLEHEHVRVEHVALRNAIPLAAFDPARFDVVAVAPRWAEAVIEVAAAAAAHRVAATALLAGHGPSLFVPSADGAFALAGHGVVDPSSMLLAAALALEHGLGERSAAETLAGAVSAALVDAPQTPSLLRRMWTTREFTHRVLAGFQLSIRNAEFWPETA
jgi:3-isopropylmalate dehydrogenase